jgi:hypothetical protein
VLAAEIVRPLPQVLADTEHFALGTTVVTNWLAQQVGAPAGLVAAAASATSGRWRAATGSGSRA